MALNKAINPSKNDIDFEDWEPPNQEEKRPEKEGELNEKLLSIED